MLLLAMRIQTGMRLVVTALLVSTLGPSAFAEIRRGSADIEFQGTSTLHDFSGTAKTDPFDALVESEGTATLVSGTATVAVARFDTGHANRDKNMRKMFDAARFPFATGTLEPVRIDRAKDSAATLVLTIRDRTTRVPATIRNWQMEGHVIRFDLDMTLSLREIGLSPPVLLGVIRVGDAVPVRVRIALEKTPGN